MSKSSTACVLRLDRAVLDFFQAPPLNLHNILKQCFKSCSGGPFRLKKCRERYPRLVLIPYQQGSLKIPPSIEQFCAWIEQCSIFSKLTHYQQRGPFRHTIKLLSLTGLSLNPLLAGKSFQTANFFRDVNPFRS